MSRSALSHNLSVARAHAGSARVWAVVKANAYGHGVATAMRAFGEADGLALLEFENALRLRSLGWSKPILMLEGAFDAEDVATAAGHGLSLAVHDPSHLELLRAHRGPPIAVWLKLNTGMNRLGVPPADARALHAALVALPSVAGVGLMTHFANADVPGGAEAQRAAFGAATEGLPGERSLANSAALVDCPDARADWVRPGILLYGATPFADRDAASLGLRPAMTLASELIAVQSLRPGDAVGYGSSFVADRPMRVGVVACGYADGYPRHAPTGTPVSVDGTRTRTVGRVSMDMLAVDLSPVPGAGPGTPVELWGARVPVDAVAASAGTIGYQLLCAVAPRVPVREVD